MYGHVFRHNPRRIRHVPQVPPGFSCNNKYVRFAVREMLHSNCKLPFIFTYIRTLEKHMAYRKKYKALILKQVPCILKYMACIFRLSKYLNNSILQKSFGKP